MKRVINYLVAISLVFPLANSFVVAKASESGFPSGNQLSAIIDVLAYVESDKEHFGLENVDFSSLQIGKQIHTYELLDSGISDLNPFFPLIYNDEIVALAVDSNDGRFQITTGLVEELKGMESLDIALLYDQCNCYVYDGVDFLLIKETTTSVPERQVLSNSNRNLCDHKLTLSNMSETLDLNYSAPNYTMGQSSQSYYSCNVSYVPQNTDGHEGSHLCWAATIACIANYRNSTNLTAIGVAQSYFGQTDYDYINQTLSITAAASILYYDYNVLYNYQSTFPSDSILFKNITYDYPVFGEFIWTSGSNTYRHFGTIYGINVLSGYISVMDPEMGASTAHSNGTTYHYLNVNGTVTLYLNHAACQYWS